ncbi:MAG: hypothetical protein JO067_12720 [Cupriavidus sp.]|nr:hypothetical protein [Cupriavidus sp.]
MVGTFDLFGWFVFNVAIPLVAPLALLPFAKLPRLYQATSHGIVLHAIRDGQLLWTAIPMSAAACYTLASGFEWAGSDSRGLWVLITTHVVIIVFASVLVLVGAMDSPLESVARDSRPHTVLLFSILLSIGSGALSFAGYALLIHPIVS